jgi:hypothetical protein
MQLDVVNYNWTRWVVNYRDETQSNVLNYPAGRHFGVAAGVLLVGGGALVLAVVAFFLLGRTGARTTIRRAAFISAVSAQYGAPRLSLRTGCDAHAYAQWLRNNNPQWEEGGAHRRVFFGVELYARSTKYGGASCCRNCGAQSHDCVGRDPSGQKYFRDQPFFNIELNKGAHAKPLRRDPFFAANRPGCRRAMSLDRPSRRVAGTKK